MKLIDRLTPSVLERARQRVARSDGVGVDRRRAVELTTRDLTQLRAAIRDGTYAPRPLFRIERPKKSGGARVLGVPTSLDRVAQVAVLLAIGARLDGQLRPEVHGSRPERSPATALTHLAVQTGRRRWLEVISVDVASMFDRLPHREVIRSADAAFDDPYWRRLVRAWCAAWGARSGTGVPQGAPLSPVLANLTLARVLDAPLAAAAGELGLIGWVRYVDDLALVAERPGDADRAADRVRALLATANLHLADAKTRRASCAAGPATLTHLGRALHLKQDGAMWVLEPRTLASERDRVLGNLSRSRGG